MKERTHRIVVIILVLAAGGTGHNVIAANDSAQVSYLFGVLPYLAPSRVEWAYSRMATEFGHALQKKVILRTSTTSEKFYLKLRARDFDIAIVNPFDSVPSLAEFGYKALAARVPHRCAVAVLDNSKITTVEELTGKTVGLASRRSPLSFFSIRALSQAGLQAGMDYSVVYFPTPHACLHKLVVNEIDACGAGGGATAGVFKSKRGIDLRGLVVCEEFPSMVAVAHSRIPAQARELLTRVLLDWPGNRKSEQLHYSSGKKAQFIAYDDGQYEIIRQYYKEWQRLDSNSP